MSNACKTLVTITAPPAKLTSPTPASMLQMLPPPTSISTLTIASVPPTLLLEPATAAAISSGSVSATTTPVDGVGQSRHTSLALTPTTTTTLGGVRTAPSAQHHVTFVPLMSMTKQGMRTTALNSPMVATVSAPSLIKPDPVVVRPRAERQQQHRALELRQSVQSQVTTVEDVDYEDDTDSDSDGGPTFDEAQVVGVIELEPAPSCGSSSSSPGE